MVDNKDTLLDLQAEVIHKKWYVRLFEFCENPFASAVLALIVYAGLSYVILSSLHKSIFKATDVAYFNYLADAILHGQFNLGIIPPLQIDLSLFQGKYYLYWSPMPAILMMPFIAIFGIGFSDILFTLVIAGVNVGLISVLLRQACKHNILELSKAQRGLLVAFFAFGTVHITLAPFGRVWFTAQLVGFLFTILAYLAAISLHGYRAWFLTGLALAGALLTRNELILVGVWPALYLLVKHYDRGRILRLAGMATISAAPIFLAIAVQCVYNNLRFGNFLDNGQAYHQMNTFLQADYTQYGLFNLHFVPINFFYQYIAYPFLNTANLFTGGSLFLLSPLFLVAFWGIVKGRTGWSTAALSISILLTGIPLLLFMGTGWMQFGPRFTLDFTVPLLLLTAMGLPYVKYSIAGLLTLISIVHYAMGTILFGIVMYR